MGASAKVERLFPYGIEINTHEKLISALIDGALENERLCEVLYEFGYDYDTLSYGDLLQVFQATSIYTVSSQSMDDPDRTITESEYLGIIAEALNEL